MRHLLTAACLLPLLAPCAGAETLPDAIRHWTGVTVDVIGTGADVRVVLPPGTPIPSVTMHAVQSARAGDRGWALSDIRLPSPTHLAGGGTASLGTQHATGWTGERTAELETRLTNVVVDNKGTHLRLDQATMGVAAANGPVNLDVDLAGLHAADASPGAAPLLPHHFVLRGHTTEDGVAALVAMFNGQPAGSAPITIDAISFDVGPAQFSGSGTVTVLGPHDRTGQVQVQSTDFKQLMQSMPDDGPLVKLYPAMMVLRAMGEKRDGKLVWTMTFAGNQVLVNGIDIAPLIGL